MEHSRLVLPARQGAEEPPSSELTPDVVQFDNVQVQASPEPAGGFLTAQHRALQRSSNADCVINRYSLWSYRQEKEVHNKCSVFLHAGSTCTQIHWPKTPTLSFHVGQMPFFQSLNWNNTHREPALHFCRWVPALLSHLGCLWKEVNVPHQRTFWW